MLLGVAVREVVGDGVGVPVLVRAAVAVAALMASGVGVIVGEGGGRKMLAPPPTSVGQAPQSSVTVSCTVTACPAVSCS